MACSGEGGCSRSMRSARKRVGQRCGRSCSRQPTALQCMSLSAVQVFRKLCPVPLRRLADAAAFIEGWLFNKLSLFTMSSSGLFSSSVTAAVVIMRSLGCLHMPDLPLALP